MDKYEFIIYISKRYGIEPSEAEYIVDMFASSLKELISQGQNIHIDEIGSFITTSLFDKKIVTFKASNQLLNESFELID